MTIEKSCQDLLLAVVSNSTDAGEIRTLASSIANWDRLIDLAMQHRVLPMLFLRLSEEADAVPEPAIERLQHEYQKIALHNMANAAELLSVLQEFSREGIQAIPFKGVVLAASTYGNILSRPSGDLDLLIDSHDLSKAFRIVLERGYELQSPSQSEGPGERPYHCEYSFVRPSDGKVLELRWKFDLVSNRFRRTLGMDWILPYRRTTLLTGAQVPDLDPQILLLILCMHGSKHCWSRLIWICDIARLIAAAPSLDWVRLLQDARRHGLKRSLALGILLAHSMAKAEVPNEVLGGFEADKTVRRIADYLTDNLLENPGQRPPGLLPYGVHLLGWRDRLLMLFSLSFLHPSDRDREVFALPQWLRSLYFLLRPLRLLSDRSAR